MRICTCGLRPVGIDEDERMILELGSKSYSLDHITAFGDLTPPKENDPSGAMGATSPLHRGGLRGRQGGMTMEKDKTMMSADRQEDAAKGQAWQMGLYERAIAKWGKRPQVVKAMEELAELGAELARAVIADEGPDDHMLSRIREELADVCIMCDQLQLIFGDVSDWETYKLERLERMLEGGA